MDNKRSTIMKPLIIRMHSSRMRTALSLPYGEGEGGSLTRGVSVQAEGRLCPGGGDLCQGGCLSRGVLCPGEGSLSRGRVSVQGEGLCPGGLYLGVSVPGVSLIESPAMNRITDRCKNITLPQLRCRR